MRVIYSPWMKEFLEAVSSVQEEILLVCPFIKLNLVELLLRKLPDSSIKIDVLTRLSLWDFQHSASDLDALDLLAKRPGAPGPTRIYRLNRLHAKVYIFDRERVFLGSSNLSVSGLDKNLEIVASVHDRKAADLLYRELGRLKAFGYELDEPDFLEMRRRLAETPAPPEALSDSTIPPEDVALELEEIVAGTAPALIDTTLETPTAKEREQKIGGFLSERARPELNCLKGKPFESTVFQADLSDNGQREQLKKIWHEAAQRDAERIRRELLPVLGLPSFADLDGAMTPFVHQNWCARFPEVLADGLQKQAFQQIGLWVTRLAIALFFSRQITFNLKRAGAASIALLKAIQDQDLDFDRFLNAKGLNVLLHLGDLAKDDARIRFETILGLQWYYRGHDAVWPYLLGLCDESLAGQKALAAQVDSKARLQEVAQKAKQKVDFDTKRIGGTENMPIFGAEAKNGVGVIGQGQGSSKREAELEAARRALEELGNHPLYSSLVKAERAGSTDVAARPYRLATERKEACEELRRRLGLPASRQPVLLDAALTDASYASDHPETRSNLHLAFIGSFLVELLATRDSIERVGWRYPAASDESARLRRAVSALVLPAAFDRMALASAFQTIGKPGTESSDRQKRDAVQALLATAFMWGGFEGVDSVWHRWISPLLEQLGSDAGVDSTTELQELVQSLAGVAPTYDEEQLPGSTAHAPTWRARVLIRDRVVAAGLGSSKLQARKEAARQALGLAQTHGSEALLDIPPEAPSR